MEFELQVLGSGVFRTLPYHRASSPSTGPTEGKVNSTEPVQVPYFCSWRNRLREEVICFIFALLCCPISWAPSSVLMRLWSLSRGTAKCMAKSTGDRGSCLAPFCINTGMLMFPLNPKDLECDKNGPTCWIAWLRECSLLGLRPSALPRMAFFPKGRMTDSIWLKSFKQIIDEKYRNGNCSLSH